MVFYLLLPIIYLNDRAIRANSEVMMVGDSLKPVKLNARRWSEINCVYKVTFRDWGLHYENHILWL